MRSSVEPSGCQVVKSEVIRKREGRNATEPQK